MNDIVMQSQKRCKVCALVLFDPRDVLARKLAYVRKRLVELGSRRIELGDGSWYWDLKPDLRPGETVTL